MHDICIMLSYINIFIMILIYDNILLYSIELNTPYIDYFINIKSKIHIPFILPLSLNPMLQLR